MNRQPKNLKKQFTAKLRKSGENPGVWTHVKMLPVNAKLRAAIGKEAGDTVSVKLLERLAR